MTRLFNTVVSTAIAVIVLIPTLHLYTRLNELSGWLTRSRSDAARISRNALKHAHGDGIELDDEHELLYHLDGISYFSPTHHPATTLSWTSTAEARVFPLTVLLVPASAGNLTLDLFSDMIRTYLEIDDVLTPAWLQTVLIVPEVASDHSTPIPLDEECLEVLHRNYGVRKLLVHPRYALPDHIPHDNDWSLELVHLESFTSGIKGPYLASTDPEPQSIVLWPVYRLYPDTYRTFLFGMYPLQLASPEQTYTYKALRKVDENGYNLIPVPSRLYSYPGGNAIHGQRFGVKDIFDVKGVTTAGGSQAYGQIYGFANITASSVARLERLGGVLVGKTKTATYGFAMGSRGHGDTIDEQYPWSPRADLWQSCMGSSSGSTCAIAAYDWLDFAVGSDTTASIRGPAAMAGVYGNRASTGVLALDGVLPLAEYCDTAGILTRDPKLFSNILRAWYGNSPLDLKSYPALPRDLIVLPKYLEQATPEAQAIVDVFVQDISRELGMKMVNMDFDVGLNNTNLDVGKARTFGAFDISAAWWSWTQIGTDLTEKWAASHDGQYPPLDPTVRLYWNTGKTKGSWQQYCDAIAFADKFKDWFNTDVLRDDEETCSHGIMIYDIGFGGLPYYREDALNADKAFNDYGQYRKTSIDGTMICSLASCADYTIPIGQVPYRSNISLVEEMRPITISIAARHGCDLVLLDFVDRLRETGLVKTVKTGRTAF